MRDSRTNILLVEDDEVDIINVNKAFQKLKITNPLYVARDGAEALAMLKGTGGLEPINPLPRIIFLDINMPRMNGIEFLQVLRADERLKSITVVVLTTSDDIYDIEATYKHNVAGYIVKPINWDKFLEAMALINSYWTLSEIP